MLIKELQILTEALWESVKNDLNFFSAISSFVKKLAEFNYSDLTEKDLLEINIYNNNIENFFSKYRASNRASIYIPPTQTSRNDQTVKRIGIIIHELNKMDVNELQSQSDELKPKKLDQKNLKPKKVFIGHGRSKLWARVQLYLKDDLKIESFTFESETQTSKSIIQILEDFLENSGFAILILTAEDETLEGKLRARQNVIHECGLFQGRLGFDNVVLLKQTEAEELSNLAGLQYIPFNEENIEQTFYELQRKLKKSGLIQ
ncbi:nucleotide-binding protein [Elizabethkingia anophelis]|nr:nucleotide-binding protein [Elizabethkingia anophelis]MCT4176843.1 nucleotide-binding protein [Elizabethkingia anophelis]